MSSEPSLCFVLTHRTPPRQRIGPPPAIMRRATRTQGRGALATTRQQRSDDSQVVDSGSTDDKRRVCTRLHVRQPPEGGRACEHKLPRQLDERRTHRPAHRQSPPTILTVRLWSRYYAKAAPQRLSSATEGLNPPAIPSSGRVSKAAFSESSLLLCHILLAYPYRRPGRPCV
jgi:hypothetical protein